MKLQLLDFIKQNKENWKEILQKPPYSLIVKEDDDYILLKYNQLESDLSNSIVQECRGIILRKSDLKVVCFPFTSYMLNLDEYSNSHHVNPVSNHKYIF